MSGCFDYGISYGCDSGCPHLLAGTCEVPEEVLGALEYDFTPEEMAELKDLYGLTEKDYESIW